MWTKRLVICLLSLVYCLSPVLCLEPLSGEPIEIPNTLDEIFNLLEQELMILRIQSEKETRQLQILEKQRNRDQNIINSLQTQSTQDKESLTKLEKLQENDKTRLTELESSLKEAEKSIIDQAMQMQNEKVKVGIIGTAVGLVAGSATVGIIWLLKMN